MLKFELVTLGGVKSSESVHEVILPTPQGQIAVFANHAPLVSVASTGIILVRQKADDPDDFMEAYAVSGGVIEVENGVVRVLVDEADDPDEINEQEVKKAHEEAKQLLKEAKDQLSLDRAQTILGLTSTRLKVAELKNRRKRR